MLKVNTLFIMTASILVLLMTFNSILSNLLYDPFKNDRLAFNY